MKVLQRAVGCRRDLDPWPNRLGLVPTARCRHHGGQDGERQKPKTESEHPAADTNPAEIAQLEISSPRQGVETARERLLGSKLSLISTPLSTNRSSTMPMPRILVNSAETARTPLRTECSTPYRRAHGSGHGN